MARETTTTRESAALLARLGSREAALRKAAGQEAGERLVSSAAPRLVELLHDRNSGVAATAAWALGRLRYVPSEQHLIELLASPTAALRKGAAWSLGRLGTPGALSALIDRLPEADETTARTLMLALEEMPAEAVAPQLAALLRDPRGPVRARAAQALLRRPAAAVPAVLEMLAALSEKENEIAIAIAVEVAADAPEYVPFRRAAAHVLANAACTEALGALLELSHVADSRTRLYAVRGLGTLAGAHVAARERLGEILTDARRDVAAAARQALGLDTDATRPAVSAGEPMAEVLPLQLAPGLTYLLTVLPGLEEIATGEIAGLTGARVTRRYSGALLVTLDAAPAALSELRTVLDALLFVARLPTPGGARAPLRDRRPARAAMAAITAARPDLPPTFYVAVPRGTPSATAAALRASAIEDLERVGARVTPAGAVHTAEVVLAGSATLLGMRVLRELPGRRPLAAGALPASLHATLAAALVRLTVPEPDDVFLDPLCGAGTLLRERALAGPTARLLGGDADEHALALARRNLQDLSGVALEQWDATRLPLDDASVHKAAFNPPYGRRSGSHDANRELYPALLAELGRVVRRGGLVAMVTAERRLAESALRAQSALAREGERQAQAGGIAVTIYLLRRR